MNSAKQDEFEDLLAFNLSETRRISLSSQAKISTVEGFVSSYNWGRIHRIYGWISDVSLKKNRRHKTMLHFSFIDGSGELINLSTCSLDLSDCYDVESFLFEFSCLDILMSEDGELEIANLSLLKKNTQKETFYKYNYNEKERLYSNTPTTTPQTKKFTHNSELILSPLRFNPTKTSVRTCDRWLKILSSNSNVAVKRRIICKLSEKVCEQVRLDVDRSFCFDSGFLNSNLNISEKRNRLYTIIIEVLQRNPEFNYYQGFHEICSVFLIIFVDNDSSTVEAIDSFSNLFLRPFLCSNSFEKILSDFTEATISLSSRYSWKMGRLARASEAEITSFIQMFNDVKEQIDLHGLVTSWFLTWFVHEFTNFNDIFHVFDFELYEMRSHLAPIYIASSMLMCEKKGLISWSGGCFELMMHIKTIPKHSNTTTIMECARNLFKVIPPEHVLMQFPSLHLSHQHKLKKKKNKLKMFTFTHFGIQFWLILLTLHFLYFVLSSTLWPFLKNY